MALDLPELFTPAMTVNGRVSTSCRARSDL
jgi:hypothetical protein